MRAFYFLTAATIGLIFSSPSHAASGDLLKQALSSSSQDSVSVQKQYRANAISNAPVAEKRGAPIAIDMRENPQPLRNQLAAEPK